MAHVLAEVLDRADSMMQPVEVMIGLQMGKVEIGVPGRIAIREEVHHVAAGQRADRVHVRGVHLQERSEVFAAGARTVEAAARVVAFRSKFGEERILHRHAGTANDLNVPPGPGRGEDHAVIIHIQDPDVTPLLLGMPHLRGANSLDALR